MNLLMNTKFFGLIVAGSSLISALSSFDSVCAATLNVTLDNTTYNLETQSGKFEDYQTAITSTAWWGNSNLAKDLAVAVGDQLGEQGNNAPNFAFVYSSFLDESNGQTKVDYWYLFKGGLETGSTPITSNTTWVISPSVTSSAATSPENIPTSAVPEPLTVLGALTAIAFGVAFKRHAAKLNANYESEENPAV